MRLLVTLLCAAGLFAQNQPFAVDTMLKLARISEPVLSRDGKQGAFTVQTIDIEKNTKPKQIYTVPLDGGLPRQITHDGTQNERPRWSPDSKQIYFVSNRDGSSQIWKMDPDGGNARQISHLSTEASGILISQDAKKIVFLSSVYPECGSDALCIKPKIEPEKQNTVKRPNKT